MSLHIGNITFDCADPFRVATFWRSALGYQLEGSGQGWEALVDPAGRSPRLYFQRVPEGKAVKNRVHLDLNSRDLEAEAGRLVRYGAVRGEHFRENGEEWIVMLDPEGNEFCVQPEE
jgi:catechol 2,3-dioxygenase-like lactoylglutathione lyase family enzyme